MSPSPEGIDLPQWQEAEPLPRPKANPRPPVQTDGGVNFYPSSARVEPGVAYQMELYLHCGYSPIDFDGTFWFPRYQKRDLRRLRRVDGEFPTGSILLLKENLALFESNSGVQVSLDRSHGPWSGWYCE